MPRWENLSIDAKLFANVQESCLTRNSAAVENAFANEAGGYTRFPGLAPFATLVGKSPTYLEEWRGDLIAVSGSKVWRIKEDGTATDITGVPVSGPNRVVFDKTPDELVMAAGGVIIRLAAATSEILSDDAPLATHVGFIDGYLLANEVGTGNFKHSAPDDFRNWDPIDVFSADSRPDKVNAILVSPYREVFIAGENSVEQFERLSSTSEIAFARRWGIGEGVLAPYTLTFTDSGTWCLNERREFVRISGQISRPVSDDVGNSIETADNIEGAWAAPLLIRGQKFIVLQFPKATNPYGSQGLTFLFDYRQNRWLSLYGWDTDLARPTRWPGWSYLNLWGRHFVGGDGEVFELKTDTYQNNGVTQRVLIRTGHYDNFGQVRIDNLRARFKRGVVGSNDSNPVISARVRLDNKLWSRFKRVELGRAGESEMYVEFGGFGCGDTFQVEFDLTDACEFEFVKAQVYLSGLGY